MNRLTLILTSAILALLFILGITYAGVRGENNNAISTVKSFLTDIKEKKYTKTEEYYTAETKKKLFKSDEDAIDFHFMLELSLLNYFDLLDSEDYSFDASWNQLWIPYVSDNSMEINLTFSQKNSDDKPWAYFLAKKDSKQAKKIITMERADGLWKISHVNLDNAAIASYYKKLASEVKANKYASVTKDGFAVKAVSVKTTQMTEREKRIMKFNFQKIIQLLEQ